MFKVLALVLVYTITDCPKVGGLEQQELISSQFCRSEDQNQGVSRAVLALGGYRRVHLWPPASGGCWPSLVCGHIPLCCLHCLLLCVHVTQLL